MITEVDAAAIDAALLRGLGTVMQRHVEAFEAVGDMTRAARCLAECSECRRSAARLQEALDGSGGCPAGDVPATQPGANGTRARLGDGRLETYNGVNTL